MIKKALCEGITPTRSQPFQVKGEPSSPNILTKKGNSRGIPGRRVTANGPRWRDADDETKLRGILVVLQKRGAKRVHLNVSAEVEAEIRQHGIEPFRRRFRRFVKALGIAPEFVLSLDIDKGGRLHLHGAVEMTSNTERAVKNALRQAAGRWDGPIGNRRQLIVNELDKPHWCASYITKSHGQLANIPGRLWTVTNDVRREAEEIHSAMRWS